MIALESILRYSIGARELADHPRRSQRTPAKRMTRGDYVWTGGYWPVDGNRLSVGIRELGYSAAIHRSVGPKTLGAQSGRLDVDLRPLRANNRRTAKLHFEDEKVGTQLTARPIISC